MHVENLENMLNFYINMILSCNKRDTIKFKLEFRKFRNKPRDEIKRLY